MVNAGDESTTPIQSADGEGPVLGGLADDAASATDLLASLVGQELVRLEMDGTVRLDIWAGPDDYQVTIGTRFVVDNGDHRFSGEPMTPEAAAALIPLHGSTVTFAHVDANAALRIGIGSATISVFPHPCYESWQVHGPRGFFIVCPPGGEYVAVWTPTDYVPQHRDNAA